MTKTPPLAYRKLEELSVKIHTYGSALTLLHWDQETYMPPGGLSPRAKQISQLSTLIHEQKTSRTFKTYLEKLIHLPSGKPKVKGLSRMQKASLREWRREYLKETKLPSSFIETFSEVTSEATAVWAEAKKANQFKLFAPFLKKIINMNRKKADILGFADHPYDALLEGYEPCMTTARVGTIFEGLQKELKDLLKKITNAKQIDNRFLKHKISDEKQIAIGKMTLSKLPVDPHYIRLDLSSHPFSLALHPHDSRITTRIIPNAFMSNIFSVLHEAGHAFYEMGLPAQHWGTPLGEYVSLSIHESQSRWWETLIGRSLPFWTFFYPHLQNMVPQLKKIPLNRFYKAINKVEPSLIRVEADEVTYCLHVILRFEIEKMLITGKLEVADLPDAWNSKMEELFGIKPPNDTQGCLQDIHWSLGDFGYFPTYALGNLFAAHFFSAFEKKHPQWSEQIAAGELAFVRDWLKEHIHRWGRTYNAEELAKRTTGKPVSEKAYCNYLKKKYGAIYGF